MVGINQKAISTSVDVEDYNYCKEKNLRFSELIRYGVRNHREGGIYEKERALDILKEKTQRLQSRLSSAFQYLAERHPKAWDDLVSEVKLK